MKLTKNEFLNYMFTYAQMKALGYRSLVHAYYESRETGREQGQ